MIVFERFGHTFKVRNDDWKNIRRRFNPDNAKVDDDLKLYYISVKCSLCKRYRFIFICREECPFEKLDGKDAGCTNFIKKILGQIISFGINTSEVCWYVSKKVLEQFKVLNDFMDKIEKENQNDKKEKLTHNE
ncbi:unnamed protein product [marine sediment metagenome]|uniref:Uncharacterized protein n=1 Tax=marine sediment metagenome TaxID=412755 RepID=X0XGX7_9ZZZZ